MENVRETIELGKAKLGIELGSTRIKAVLIGEDYMPIAQGGHAWENRLEQGVWTYHLEDVWNGLQEAFASLKKDVMEKYDVKLTRLGGIGISAMMHGYMAFDEKDELLVPFRTWRNTMTAEASKKLTELFQYPIPQRWSIAHLQQAILNKEEHVAKITHLTTLAGYVHWRLTGRKVLGVGEASGMFPIDLATKKFQTSMIDAFDAANAAYGYPWKLADILPEVLEAGEQAGVLTAAGARFLDPTKELMPGCPCCPPEGDAGTGMTATNSVAKRTGNVSAGTSVFAMVVLEKELSKVHPEIDLVTTPAGDLVAMVHCNNCTSDLNAWVSLFREFGALTGHAINDDELYGTLYRHALSADADCGGLMAYNYFSGEHVTGFEEGRPLFVRTPDAKFTLANFMRTHLYTSLGALKVGLDILFQEEKVKIDSILGHGGLFKTKQVGQQFLAGAINAPVSVMETAGEGGAWGIALLAAYMEKKAEASLAEFLSDCVFAGQACETVEPKAEDVAGFAAFIEKYRAGLKIERAAVESIC